MKVFRRRAFYFRKILYENPFDRIAVTSRFQIVVESEMILLRYEILQFELGRFFIFGFGSCFARDRCRRRIFTESAKLGPYGRTIENQSNVKKTKSLRPKQLENFIGFSMRTL